MNLLYAFTFAASERKIRTLTVFNRSTSMYVQKKSFNVLRFPHGIVAETSFNHFINFRRTFTAYGQNLSPKPCSFKSAIRELRIAVNI